MSALSPRSGIQVSSVYHPHTHIKGQEVPLMCVCVCVCVTKTVAVKLHCPATALITYMQRTDILALLMKKIQVNPRFWSGLEILS